jgi:hypothetical protein
VFDHADRSVQFPSQTLGILDPSARTVYDVVPAVGDERRSVRCRASCQPGDKIPELPRGRGPTERHDFYRHQALDAEALYQLGLVHDDDQVLAGAGDDLLAQERAAATFEEIERGDLDLVSTVDRDVNVIVLR